MKSKLLIVSLSIFACLTATSAKAATTSAWYFAETGTTVPPASWTAPTTPVSPSPALVTSYVDSLSRAPGLAPDLTSYFMNGTYITPSMVFAPAVSMSVLVPFATTIAPTTFVPRNANSAITFNQLPTAGAVFPKNEVLMVRFAYVNPGSDREVVVRDDVFTPAGAVMSSSSVRRSVYTNEYMPFTLPLYVGNIQMENGVYGIRIRVYDSIQQTVLDENSFNVMFK